MIKILREKTGKLIREFKYDNEPLFVCSINDYEYKLSLLRGSVIGTEDIQDEYNVLVNLINTMFTEGYNQEEMNEELGVEFIEYRNKVFSETYETIKDSRENARMKSGMIYVINHSKI